MSSKVRNVIIHTDGACSGNPGPGGWAAILEFGKARKEITGSSPDTTNNRMELEAVVNALSALTEPCSVVIKSDSRYVVTSMGIYMHDWVKREWRKSDGDMVKHADLWQQIYAFGQTHRLFPLWIPREQNSQADALAKAAVPA